MEVDMALDIKTTILFDKQLHGLLADLAKKSGTSIGELVREACKDRYGREAVQRRLRAVEELSKMSLPVSDVATMKRESMPVIKPLP